ncbi:MAG: uroporphyrinogen-III synthase [Acidobacteriota bacterium]|nr:uroporphyrinogen-III synthase [Acidobacteriota bacterium]
MTAPPNQFNRSLAGRTVVIIDPEKLRLGYVDELEAYGAQIILCPPVEIAELESYEELDDAIDHLYGYDWLLFTSVPGVESFLRRLRQKGLDSSALDELRVCAAGDATEKRLLEEHVHVDVASSATATATLFAALECFLGGRAGFSGLNFLSPRAVVARDSFTRALNEAGARVDLVHAYRIQSSTEVNTGRTAAMFSAAADCIVLTSPASVAQLARLFDAHDLAGALAKVLVICISAATAAAAMEQGLDVKVPAPATVATLAEAIAEEFSC